MLNSYKNFWKGYTNWSGKTSRWEYWQNVIYNIFILFFILVLLVTYSKFTRDTYGPAFLLLFSLPIYFASIITPFISLIVRRLRDADFHWAWVFLLLIPFAGWLVVFVLNQLPSKQRSQTDNDKFKKL